MLIILSLIALLLVIFIVGKVGLSIRFHKQVKQLFAQSKNISGQTFSYSQLVGLPEPVQRYFRHVLKDGQPYISYARLQHTGQFKSGLDKPWGAIKGEQYFTTQKPGFIWKGTTSLFVARDMYLCDSGRLTVSLFSLFPVVDGKGDTFNQGELLRWLGESIWFPTNLLPSERLQWTPVDAHSASLTFTYNGLSLFYLVTISDAGEITQLETKRYMDSTHLETWICRAGNYQELNGIIVPLTAEASWQLADKNVPYARFTVTTLEYEKPLSF